jgi:lipopolysaccharide transport system ATP-binding protein
MSDIAIRVEGIGKKYRIGQKKSGELRETFGNLFRSFKLANDSQQPAAQKEFWALKDISFEVKPGEAVGIIGRNGAGKSTLLKVLSRITKPTSGRFEINGRVSSLLEVGTGFHPELTGRENIYLNGTILGMRRAEIKAKFDEIIAFSGVEEFIDTAVKHYSSGMKVRLAFSVAAHLEPEILIIDEVLAVGDAEFQKKCLGKMEDVTGEGRTVLFVSHNMGAVERLCSSGIVLYKGTQEFMSNKITNVIDKYLTNIRDSTINKTACISFYDNEIIKMSEFSIIENESRLPTNGILKNDGNYTILIVGELLQHESRIEIGIVVKKENGIELFRSFYYDKDENSWPVIENLFMLNIPFPKRLLNEGVYHLELIVGVRRRKWFIGPNAFSVILPFEIRGGLSDSPLWYDKRPGLLAPNLEWKNESK